ADAEPRELGPVALGLGARRGLDPTPGALRRGWVAGPEVALDGAEAPRIALLVDEPLVQRRQVQPLAIRPPFEPDRDGRFPVLDAEALQTAAVDRAGRLAAQVIPDGPFGHVQGAGNLARRDPSSRQLSDRHPSLPSQLDRHRAPSPPWGETRRRPPGSGS